MKKLYAAISICALALTVGVTAMAQGKTGTKGTKQNNSCCSIKGDVTPEQINKFKADTIDLRQELMNKRFELQRENLKETPDSTRVEALKTEIDAIRTKIEAVRESSKLPETVCHKVCQMMDEDGSHCNKAHKHGCKDCQKGQNCSDCNKCKDCSCTNCKKGKDCSNCDLGKKGKIVRPGCKNCNTRK